TYRLPDFKRIPAEHIARFIQVTDLVGISVFSKQVVVPQYYYSQYPKFSVRDLRAGYEPVNLSTSFIKTSANPRPLDRTVMETHDIAKNWLESIAAHPGAYIRHRWYVFKAFLGFGQERPYIFTYNTIDPNRFGIVFHPNFATPWMLAYIT